MDRLRFSRMLFLTALCLSGWSTSLAAPRLPGLSRLNRVEADPQKEYLLTENQGPWMAFAASFAGDRAPADAHKLVLELRSRYRLPAYVHKKHYDFRKPVVGNGVELAGTGPQQHLEPKRMKYARSYAYDEVAVLVGDFTGVNDPSIQEVLDLLKYARPKCLEIGDKKDTTLRYAGLRMLQRKLSGDEKKKRRGPMGRAFVTRNPLLPEEYFVPKGVDRFVQSINKGVKYSLLDCPGKYTVRVATFCGNVIIDQKKILAISQGSASMKSQLHLAADKAHRLTVALRKQGIEAYEFHDRHESIVTVGSFDSQGTPLPDGSTEINPAILGIIRAYGPRRQPLPGGGSQTLAGLQPRSLGGIPFDVQPIPTEVPRRSIAADYARSRLPR